MVKILFVCYGNICRSPMAEFVMKDIAEKNGLDIYVASAATSTEEIGNSVHYGTKNKLAQKGISVSGKTAVQMKKNDYEKYDYIIGMDQMNMRSILRITGGDPDGKIYKMMSFAGSDRDVADPWYTGDFDTTYNDIIKGCEGLINELREKSMC